MIGVQDLHLPKRVARACLQGGVLGARRRKPCSSLCHGGARTAAYTYAVYYTSRTIFPGLDFPREATGGETVEAVSRLKKTRKARTAAEKVGGGGKPWVATREGEKKRWAGKVIKLGWDKQKITTTATTAGRCVCTWKYLDRIISEHDCTRYGQGYYYVT